MTADTLSRGQIVSQLRAAADHPELIGWIDAQALISRGLDLGEDPRLATSARFELAECSVRLLHFAPQAVTTAARLGRTCAALLRNGETAAVERLVLGARILVHEAFGKLHIDEEVHDELVTAFADLTRNPGISAEQAGIAFHAVPGVWQAHPGVFRPRDGEHTAHMAVHILEHEGVTADTAHAVLVQLGLVAVGTRTQIPEQTTHRLRVALHTALVNGTFSQQEHVRLWSRFAAEARRGAYALSRDDARSVYREAAALRVQAVRDDDDANNLVLLETMAALAGEQTLHLREEAIVSLSEAVVAARRTKRDPPLSYETALYNTLRSIVRHAGTTCEKPAPDIRAAATALVSRAVDVIDRSIVPAEARASLAMQVLTTIDDVGLGLPAEELRRLARGCVAAALTPSVSASAQDALILRIAHKRGFVRDAVSAHHRAALVRRMLEMPLDLAHAPQAAADTVIILDAVTSGELTTDVAARRVLAARSLTILGDERLQPEYRARFSLPVLRANSAGHLRLDDGDARCLIATVLDLLHDERVSDTARLSLAATSFRPRAFRPSEPTVADHRMFIRASRKVLKNTQLPAAQRIRLGEILLIEFGKGRLHLEPHDLADVTEIALLDQANNAQRLSDIAVILVRGTAVFNSPAAGRSSPARSE